MQNNIFLLTSTVSRIAIRSYARKAAKRIPNPGIQRRLNILTEKEPIAAGNDLNVDELESDFMNLGHIHKEHEQELKHYKEKEKYWIVKQKYFEENKINFLTWADKEQIRYLHQSNPEEWTIERLSEGFPALPATIAKIIKIKWEKKKTKITNHDKAVENNWNLLRQGKFNHLPPQLIAHITKFSNRKRDHVTKESDKHKIKTTQTNAPPKTTEFSSIINSYQELKNSKPKEEILEINPNAAEQRLIGTSRKINNKLTTLSEFKESMGEENAMQNIVKEDVILNEMFEKKSAENSINIYSTVNDVIKNKTEVHNQLSKPSKSLELTRYPEKITIPKDKYKRGFTYKLNDCYYDDDGEFLYRVPGMYK